MKGIRFVMNDEGQQVAVMIDLHKYRAIWEDFYDTLVARSREHEPRETLESVKQRLQAQGKLHE